MDVVGFLLNMMLLGLDSGLVVVPGICPDCDGCCFFEWGCWETD